MVLCVSVRAQDHRAAFQVFNHDLEMPIVEEIAHSEPAAHLRYLHCRTTQFADIAKRSVMLIRIHQLWFSIHRACPRRSHLRIDVAVHENEVEPATVIEVEERISPADIRRSSACN